ncbi:MAG: hypothetical protein ACI87J_002330 [Colwellia sp.]|jgi:hypothetical protein
MHNLTPSKLSHLQWYAFIESAITEKGYVGTPELMRAFLMTRLTASKTINEYINKYPNNLIYCDSRKRYLATDLFTLVAIRGFGVSTKAFLNAVVTMSLHGQEGIFKVKKRHYKPKYKKLEQESIVQHLPRITKPKYYFYEHKTLNISQIIKESGVNKARAYKALKLIPQNTNVTNIIYELLT